MAAKGASAPRKADFQTPPTRLALGARRILHASRCPPATWQLGSGKFSLAHGIRWILRPKYGDLGIQGGGWGRFAGGWQTLRPGRAEVLFSFSFCGI